MLVVIFTLASVAADVAEGRVATTVVESGDAAAAISADSWCYSEKESHVSIWVPVRGWTDDDFVVAVRKWFNDGTAADATIAANGAIRVEQVHESELNGVTAVIGRTHVRCVWDSNAIDRFILK
jgi:hypothetical protein